jgi:bifunctional non-homologous end joining protein LigD
MNGGENGWIYLHDIYLVCRGKIGLSQRRLMHPAASLLTFLPMDSPSDRLSHYRAKRSLERTPEPAGSLAGNEGVSAGGGLFVVHKHAARRLHYDLRLEMDGVLRSWAVPKGPSFDPTDKRLAVLVEDHPLEYGDFEGVIPAGNYGAGAVIVWDRGRWIPLEDPTDGLANGKLLFELHGIKLRGRWTLVKLKKGEQEWLLIKERDGYVSSDGAGINEASVLSGLTVDDLKAGRTPGDAVGDDLLRLKAARTVVRASDVRLMLAESRDRPFRGAEWLFELKLDGYRALAARDGGAQLLSRNGNDLSPCFPEIVQALRALPFDRLVLDGELVALDEQGRPNFQRLQQRAQLRRGLDIRHASVECPVTYFAFDLLGFGEFDLRRLWLVERKALLARVVPTVGILRVLDHFEAEGELLYEQVQKIGLEGIVGKRRDSIYKPGRTPAWVKIRTRRSDDFVIVGFSSPKGSRSGFGALYLGKYYDEGQLIYCGRAGSGFTEEQLTSVRATLDALRRPEPACAGTLPQEPGTAWVEPRLVCEVEFTEWTEEGLLRQPVFLRFRDDKNPEECVAQATLDPPTNEADPRPRSRKPSVVDAEERSIDLTNVEKVFWPEDGYTKGDLLEYYRTIAPQILPYLADRPLVLTRFPDGIAGKSFFQMDAPRFVPEWIRRERRWSEQAEREIDYFVCDDEESLLYLVNLGTIPLHIWSSRVSDIEHPDWCVLDLDPKGAPFADVVEVAQATHRLCDRLGLPNFVKSSGSSGLHVMIPLGCQCRHDEARSLGELLARLVTAELPDITTVARQISRREGKVYIDYLQNGTGRLIVAPFSVRPLPGAPVSAPLRWSEVTPDLDIRRLTIRTMPARVRKMRRDPLTEILRASPDLGAALERVQSLQRD